VRRGGRDIKKMPRSLLVMERTGWSLTNNVSHGVLVLEKWLVSDHPVCGAKVGFANFSLMPQPPLLTRRGLEIGHFTAA